MHDNSSDAQLRWSDERPDACLGWRMAADGSQRLGFEDGTGAPLEIRALEGATIWLDPARGHPGCLTHPVAQSAVLLVQSSPAVAPKDAGALSAALPATLEGLALPRPRTTRHTRRTATRRLARLTLGEEQARDGPRYYGTTLRLPTLTLRFVYDGHADGEGEADPQFVDRNQNGDQIVTLTRDHAWEASCFQRLIDVGALPVDELEVHWPSEQMIACDFVFAVCVRSDWC